MYSNASRHYNKTGKGTTTRPSVIQHFFFRPEIEEYWKQHHSDMSREEFSKMMQDQIWDHILKHPYDKELEDKIPFGQYKDMTYKQIFKEDIDYLVWLLWTKRNSKSFMKVLCSNVEVGFVMKRLFALR